MSSSRSVLRVWALALALSVVLVAAGERWPDPLPIRGSLVWGLVLLPPLLMVLVLRVGWSLAPSHQEGESDQFDRENG